MVVLLSLNVVTVVVAVIVVVDASVVARMMDVSGVAVGDAGDGFGRILAVSLFISFKDLRCSKADHRCVVRS